MRRATGRSGGLNAAGVRDRKVTPPANLPSSLITTRSAERNPNARLVEGLEARELHPFEAATLRNVAHAAARGCRSEFDSTTIGERHWSEPVGLEDEAQPEPIGASWSA
jgi:hypothetical protein